MKKFGFILISIFIIQLARAQYCGSPDTITCTATNVPGSPGLYPTPDSFPAALNNFLSSATIYFRNYDTILFGNQVLPVYSLTWNTINNLPPGLCWSTNKTNNTFGRAEAGCIHLRGLACGATGQYKLSTLVTVDIGVPVQTNGDPGGLRYFVRLQNPGNADIPVDTAQTDSTPFISYGGICQNLSPLNVSLGADQTVCSNSIVTFHPQVSGGQGPYTYNWQSTGSNIICPACENASVTVSQNSVFILKVTDAGGRYGYDTVNYFITGTAYNFQITSSGPGTYCGGGTVTLTANPNDSLSFQWYNNSVSIAGAGSRTITVTDTSGAYYLQFTEAGVCTATSNVINLIFYDTTAVSINAMGSDTLCVGGSVTLLASAQGSGLNYAWFLNDSNLLYNDASFVAVNPGAYQVAVTNTAGCTDTSTAVLVVASPNFPPTISYTQFISDTFCNNATSIVLTGGEPGGGYYSGTGVSNGVFDPSAASAGLNYIYYNYTDSTGCGNAVYDTAVVLICTGINNLSTPNTISLYPNPCTDNLTVESDLLLLPGATLRIYDINGRQLQVTTIAQSAGKALLNISNLPLGCYWLGITAAGTQTGRRFIRTE